jgi:hypothetical protein
VTFTGAVQGAGIKPSNDLRRVASWRADSSALVLREGDIVAGGGKLKAVTSFSVRDGEVVALGTLVPERGLVTAANDTVMLRITPAGTSVLLREGMLSDLQDTAAASPIKTITTLLPAAWLARARRWQASGSAIARVTLVDKRSALVGVASDGTIAPTAQDRDSATEIGASAFWSTIGLPALETAGMASW